MRWRGHPATVLRPPLCSLLEEHTATDCSHCDTLQHTATHCNTLQHTSAHYSTLLHWLLCASIDCAAHCNALRVQHTASHCNTLQLHCATHCNTLQHTATHCNTLQHTATSLCSTLQRTTCATHCITLQHTASHCNTLHHTATHCNTLQHTATSLCNTLQRTTCALKWKQENRSSARKQYIISRGVTIKSNRHHNVLQDDTIFITSATYHNSDGS